jgi:hypothetical protein
VWLALLWETNLWGVVIQTYASFHISITKDDSVLINNEGVYPCIYDRRVLCWTLADFSVSWSCKVGRTHWMRDHPVARPLPTHRTTQTYSKYTQTSIPWVGFEPTIPECERAKTVHSLNCAATVISLLKSNGSLFAPFCRRLNHLFFWKFYYFSLFFLMQSVSPHLYKWPVRVEHKRLKELLDMAVGPVV